LSRKYFQIFSRPLKSYVAEFLAFWQQFPVALGRLQQLQRGKGNNLAHRAVVPKMDPPVTDSATLLNFVMD
jgi:hypothetical protein